MKPADPAGIGVPFLAFHESFSDLTALVGVMHFPSVLARLLREPGAEQPGGEGACYAHLVCPDCGAVVTEGHRSGCRPAAGS